MLKILVDHRSGSGGRMYGFMGHEQLARFTLSLNFTKVILVPNSDLALPSFK
jgi:hypothetical protein